MIRERGLTDSRPCTLYLERMALICIMEALSETYGFERIGYVFTVGLLRRHRSNPPLSILLLIYCGSSSHDIYYTPWTLAAAYFQISRQANNHDLTFNSSLSSNLCTYSCFLIFLDFRPDSIIIAPLANNTRTKNPGQGRTRRQGQRWTADKIGKSETQISQWIEIVGTGG